MSPVSCYGKYHIIASLSKTFSADFCNFLFNLGWKKEEKDLCPLIPLVVRPNWALDSLRDRTIQLKLFEKAWQSILIAKDLNFFPMTDIGKNNY